MTAICKLLTNREVTIVTLVLPDSLYNVLDITCGFYKVALNLLQILT